MWLLSFWLAAGLLTDAIVSNHARRKERWYGPLHLALSFLLGLPLLLLVLVMLPFLLARRRG